MDRPTTELFELVSGQSQALAYDLVDPLTRFLTIARETVDGDLEKVLVMIVITLRSSRHPEFKRIDVDGLEPDEALPGLGANVQSIAQSTGIPKETVRRKVQHLIDAGWVIREGRTLRYSLEGYRAMAPAREAIIRMYVRGYQVIGALAAE